MSCYVPVTAVGLGTETVIVQDARSGKDRVYRSRWLSLVDDVLCLPGRVTDEAEGFYAVAVGTAEPVWVARVLVRDVPEIAA